MTFKKLYEEMNNPDFWKFIEKMKEDGTLQSELPEVFALIDTPERATYHAEGTTYNHTILVLKQVELACNDKDRAVLNFCALCHDLGKALTPKDILPKHIGHEVRGLPVIRQLCQRLSVPVEFEDKAILCCKYHMAFMRCSEMRTVKLMKFVKEVTDEFSNHDNLAKLITLSYCDSNGRLCDEVSRHKHEETWAKCFDLCVETYHFLKDMSPANTPEFQTNRTGQGFIEAWDNFRRHKLNGLLNELKFELKDHIHYSFTKSLTDDK